MSDQDWRQVKVTFRKAVSDGNYGTESAEVLLEKWMPRGLVDAEITGEAATLLQEARHLVHNELQQSSSPRVREAIGRIRHYSGGAGEDDDGEE